MPGQTQQVQPRGVVFLESRGQDRSFPGGRRQFETIELRDDLAQPVDARQSGSGPDVLPIEQESHEIRRTHRLDLRAQSMQGVTMDARQQRALAPLRAGRVMPEPPSQNDALRFQ
jgi:hypothetical protein